MKLTCPGPTEVARPAGDGKPGRVLEPGGGWIADIAVVPGKPRAIAADHDGGLTFWDIESGKALAALRLPGIVHSIAVSPDGARLAAGSQDGTIAVIDVPKEAR
jgi:WD40 repeat protein